MGNHNNSKFYAHNKVSVKSCVHFYHECWKRRYIVLHDPEVQQKVLKEEVEAIMEGANKEEIEELRRYVQTNAINSNLATAEEIFSWVRSIRVFKRRAQKSEHADIRYMLNVFVN